MTRPRPRLTTTYQGRRVGPRCLVAMLEEHLDRGHPTVEQADDIRLIAKALEGLAVPRTNQRALLERIRTVNSSRSVLSWIELEDELGFMLERVIRRYRHTHPPKRRGLPSELRSKLTSAANLPSTRAHR